MGSTSSAAPSSRPSSSAARSASMSTTRAARGVHEPRSRASSSEQRRIHDAARLVVQRHVQEITIGLPNSSVARPRAARTAGKSASLMYGSQAITSREDIRARATPCACRCARARGCRASSARGGASLPGGQVVPTAGADVAVVDRQVANQCERHRERVGRDLAHAVVGRVGDPHAMARGTLRYRSCRSPRRSGSRCDSRQRCEARARSSARTARAAHRSPARPRSRRPRCGTARRHLDARPHEKPRPRVRRRESRSR